MTAPKGTAGRRVEHTMELLSLPMGCGFLASAVGLLCMLSSEVQMVRRVFFVPLITVQVVTFFLGTCSLPSLLYMVPCHCLSVGPDEPAGPPEKDTPDAGNGTGDILL
ncbi:unnamed protein product [Prorocentrum cordatum]|uniref:Uncharacterized protein n=1 Tax=Prorocentrum cordatum TaxID=2364126 RepID=A0ABN9UB59_9DINO|nr:unnamed protein product [Polarella glacialis]